MSIYPHRLLAFSQNVRPSEGSWPTWSYNGRAAVTHDQSGRESYAGSYALMHDRKHLSDLGKARGQNRADYDCHIFLVPDLASQE